MYKSDVQIILRMPRPRKHPTTEIYYFTVRVPSDLIEKIGKRVYNESLGTKDPDVAKELFAQRYARAKREEALLRTGPTPLTEKQTQALAGEYYRHVRSQHEDNPGDPEEWSASLDGSEELGRTAAGRERMHGAEADRILLEAGVLVDQPSRAALLLQMHFAYNKAVFSLIRNGQNDYSPDPAATRFPPISVISSKPKVTTSEPPDHWTFTRAIDDNVKRRATGKDASPLRPATVAKLRRVAKSFTAFRSSDDLTTLTTKEVNGWIVDMLKAGNLTNKTINDRVGSLKMIVGYAIALSSKEVLGGINPVSGALVPEVAPRPKGLFAFTMAEARTILCAARKEARAERRWATWIMAYSGARVNEVANLLATDFRLVEGRWFFEIGSGGIQSVKNESSMRTVPVHSDLVQEGLMQFIEGHAGERLFPVRTTQNLGDWVNKDLGCAREGLRPNHGWRHLFEDMCTGSGMQGKAVDYITGRAGNGYGGSDAQLPGLTREMGRFPGYGL